MSKAIVITGIIMFFGIFWIMWLSNAWVNSPTDFTWRFEIENGTQEVLKGLNGSIIINNYYGNFTKEITLCKDSVEYITLDNNGQIFKQERFEEVYNCNLTIK